MKAVSVPAVFLALCLLFLSCGDGDSPFEDEWEEDDYVYVSSGSFQMGDAAGGYVSAQPVHEVYLGEYNISRYQVTQGLYQSVMGYNPGNFKGSRRPVDNVTWYDAVEFCNKLSEREGYQPVYTISGRNPETGYPIISATVTWDRYNNNYGYRLPTEAEWEYAAKGWDDESSGYYIYSGSNDVNSVAWYYGNSGGTTHDVGTKAPNKLGIYDMSGNVWEWCWDWYGEYMIIDQNYYPTGASSGTVRVARGGSWRDTAENAGCAFRGFDKPSRRYSDLGFRIVRSRNAP